MRGGPPALQNCQIWPNLGVRRASRSAVLALAIQGLDGSERFGLRTHPHVKILSKFEVLGPRNGRGATWQNASLVKVVFLRFGAVKSGKRCLLHTFFSPFDYD